MQNSNRNIIQPVVTVDIKKNRIRFHKNTINALGNPLYYRLLVNPTSKGLIIENCDKDEIGARRLSKTSGSHDYEIYSHTLVHEIFNCAGKHDTVFMRLTGKCINEGRAAFFSLVSDSNIKDMINI